VTVARVRKHFRGMVSGVERFELPRRRWHHFAEDRRSGEGVFYGHVADGDSRAGWSGAEGQEECAGRSAQCAGHTRPPPNQT
jgi:hypothetical protein